VNVAALIVAAGRGTRAGVLGGRPKQYALLAGRPVLAWSLDAFVAEGCRTVVVAISPDDAALYASCIAGSTAPLLPAVTGGATRQASVLAGLEALAALPTPPDLVLIHDAARPLADAALIRRVTSALAVHPGAIPALPVSDTLKRGDDTGLVAGTVDRAGLFAAQTPQGFRFPDILAAHRAAQGAAQAFTDDAAIAEWAEVPIAIVAGDPRNIKLTQSDDLALLERTAKGVTTMETRSGLGFDVHRFCPGDHVWLAGVRIAHSAGLEGHSDADVALHALTDAVLGAIADGDIGQHFPPSDPQWAGAASRLFLADAAERVRRRGGIIANVDLTILCEAPRIGPHRTAMQAAIGAVLGLPPERIGIKATTTEGLGFTGRREGIAAMATATVRLPAANAPLDIA